MHVPFVPSFSANSGPEGKIDAKSKGSAANEALPDEWVDKKSEGEGAAEGWVFNSNKAEWRYKKTPRGPTKDERAALEKKLRLELKPVTDDFAKSMIEMGIDTKVILLLQPGTAERSAFPVSAL